VCIVILAKLNALSGTALFFQILVLLEVGLGSSTYLVVSQPLLMERFMYQTPTISVYSGLQVPVNF
jgi:hypothetical protein